MVWYGAPERPEQALPYLMLDAGHLARWRGHCLARLVVTPAFDDLGVALAAMPDGQNGRSYQRRRKSVSDR